MGSAHEEVPNPWHAVRQLLGQENLPWREKVMRVIVAVALAMVFAVLHYADVVRRSVGREPKRPRP